MLAALCLGLTNEHAGWLAASRAKHASLIKESMSLFAAVANTPDATPDIEQQQEYHALTLEGAASSWNALDGHQERDFIGFADEAYAGMRDDASRTPFFAQAIAARLAEAPPRTLAVLDIGTGPHAVLALLAARSGARKGASRTSELSTTATWPMLTPRPLLLDLAWWQYMRSRSTQSPPSAHAKPSTRRASAM